MIAFILTQPNLRSKYQHTQLFDVERGLVLRLRNADVTSFHDLYKMYAPSLFGVIMKIVEHRETAEDLLQEVFIKIIRSFHSYAPERARLFTWLLNIARNTAMDHLRLRSTRDSQLTTGIETGGLLDHHSYSINTDTIGLRDMINGMDSRHCDLLDLFYYKGYSHTEIAELLNMPIGTVKTRIRQAILQLRNQFSRCRISSIK
ncbi:RNA polymerase sigma factor [Pedobacter endophyticus]|uniref:RNA polymerase sigma factor n=1 Tax=Pedobacter endophyticus TaxID=2789740 RepID=A0A7S9L153_9SPHI|nr:sigma-70 family RNA polymerase sigma factor [Pedobacter endophyticus]QPH40584.1 sigma-70 family RNA polymerase sigma factor [Pedobacter endophyticus]